MHLKNVLFFIKFFFFNMRFLIQVRSHTAIEKHIPFRILFRIDKNFFVKYPNRKAISYIKNFLSKVFIVILTFFDCI